MNRERSLEDWILFFLEAAATTESKMSIYYLFARYIYYPKLFIIVVGNAIHFLAVCSV